MKILVFTILLSSFKIFPQEITVSVDTLNVSIKEFTISIPYKFKNHTDKEITFLDKQDFSVIDRCYYISKSKERYHDVPDTMRLINDFITLKPHEEIEKSIVLYIHWPCRSGPTGHFSYNYRSSVTTEDNYYYILNNDKYEKVFLYSWTGEIISPVYNITLFR